MPFVFVFFLIFYVHIEIFLSAEISVEKVLTP